MRAVLGWHSSRRRRDLDEVDKSNGIARLMRIAWYRDKDHWLETRQAWLEPVSAELFARELYYNLTMTAGRKTYSYAENIKCREIGVLRP